MCGVCEGKYCAAVEGRGVRVDESERNSRMRGAGLYARDRVPSGLSSNSIRRVVGLSQDDRVKVSVPVPRCIGFETDVRLGLGATEGSSVQIPSQKREPYSGCLASSTSRKYR